MSRVRYSQTLNILILLANESRKRIEPQDIASTQDECAQDVHKRATSTSAIDIAGFTKGPLKTIGKILLVFVVDEDGTRPEITLDEAKALFLAAPYSVSECVTLPQ